MSKKPEAVVAPVAEEMTAVSLVPTAAGGISLLEEMSAELIADAAAAPSEFAAADVAIPFLRVIQSGSPELKRTNAKYIEGAKDGMILNTVTKVARDRLIIIPVAFRRSYTEWKLRDESGGGFVKDHGSDEAVMQFTTKDDKNRDMTTDGTQIVFANLYFCIVIDPEAPGEGPTQALLSLSSTQLKKGRQWNAVISQFKITLPNRQMITPPMWYRAYELTTVAESNDKGEWMGVKITPHANVIDLPGGRQLYALGKEFHALVTAGGVKTDLSQMDGFEGGEGRPVAGAAALDGKSEDQIPF